ncbi:uncharacterized protein LOC115334115 [Aquila chrysaetos chrysaetos]|uniref:uncharacterized protein LOC115334115 n=1 Tax=Aquila chrysaetos chrysaetos TaxID=223781 RepID=UPI001176D717|nr:uncharacterized protein LOC115334115 [Aquila chrysaetos chrysaetos]
MAKRESFGKWQCEEAGTGKIGECCWEKMAGLSGLLCYICAFHERKKQGSSLGFNSPFAPLTPLQKQNQKQTHALHESIARKTVAAVTMSLAQRRKAVRGMRWCLQLQPLLLSSLCSPPKDEKWGGRTNAPHASPGSHVESFWWEAGWQQRKFMDRVCEPAEKTLEPTPAGSKTDPPLVKAEPISNSDYRKSLIILQHKRSLAARSSPDVSDLQLSMKVTKV